jgi:lipid II:glycine glycyltransferase (peptidoglycan interpeptide bridge formation enzyme)
MNRRDWNVKVAQYAPAFGAFLQSYEWGEFNASIGRKVHRFVREENGKTLIGQGVMHHLPFGQEFAFLPKGPLGDMNENAIISILREEFAGALFLRIEPNEPLDMVLSKERSPAHTLTVDLRQSEEDLLGSFKSKTRYNVRLGKRKGVVVRKEGSTKHITDFARLLEQTAVRDKINTYPISYYKAMVEAMQGEARAFMAYADFEGRPIAANLYIDFLGTRTYLHGATSNLHRNVMAQYVLHYEMMVDAKRAGLSTFDFWGIAPEGASEKHPWQGISRYKRGFIGNEIAMPGTYELCLKPIMYSAYSGARSLLRR